MRVSEHLGLTLHERGDKPRTAGYTSVIDGGSPLPVLEDLLVNHGEFIDIIKPTGQFLVAPIDELRKRVGLIRSHGVDVQPSGIYLELARLQKREREVLSKLKEIGFTHVEVSSSTTDNNTAEDDQEFTGLCMEMGFKPVGEVGKKFFEGDRTRTAEDQVDIDTTIREMQGFLDVGVEHIYWEGNILRKVIGEDPATIEAKYESAVKQITAVTDAIPVDRIVFEVTSLLIGPVRRMLQQWFIREFGPDVNLANIPPRDVSTVEMMRRGTMVVHGLGRSGDHPWVRSIASDDADASSQWWRK